MREISIKQKPACCSIWSPQEKYPPSKSLLVALSDHHRRNIHPAKACLLLYLVTTEELKEMLLPKQKVIAKKRKRDDVEDVHLTQEQEF
jgi:hypothetical protein